MGTRDAILLIEADLAWRERVHHALTPHGYSLRAVASPQQALEVLKHERPALILIDLQPDDPQEAECVERIRAFDTSVPIVLLESTSEDGSSTPAPLVQGRLPRERLEAVLLPTVQQCLAHPPRARPERWPGMGLVVADEPKISTIFHDFLQLHGFTVTTAANGQEALAAFARETPAVVLLDIRMPGTDGLFVLKQMKTQHPATTVVMITGFEEERTMQQALALGADDYIMKPFSLEYLETILLSKLLLGAAP